MSHETFFENQKLPGWVFTRFDLTQSETHCGGDITDPNTPMPLASVTKTFTSHLCLQPACRNYLDRPIQEVIPYFHLQDTAASQSMTPRDALCHFSGFAPQTADWVRCPLSRKAYIQERLPLLPSAGPFREKHRYSNIMYAVLGQWLTELRAKSWENLVSDEIFTPLGMHNTCHLDASWTSQAPLPHKISADGEYAQIPPFYAQAQHLIAPASEVMGSMPDLARWGQYMLSLDPQDPRWQPHSIIREHPRLDYGLGWRLDHINGSPRFWHSGQCSGYSTLLTLYPQQKIGLAAATNCSEQVDILHALDLEQMK